MNQEEKQTIKELHQIVQELRNENSKFREDVNAQIESINSKRNTKNRFI
jgi:hypothetical protein